MAPQSETGIDPPQFERRIAHDYFVRFHMSVILAAVISSGVLASKFLMVGGVPLGYRYPLAVLVSYAVFLLLVRIWIWYVSVRCGASSLFGNLSFDGGGNSGGGWWPFGGRSGGSTQGGGFSGFGGGDSGGAGATSSWESGVASQAVAPSSGGSKWLPDIDLGGGGDDNCWLVIVLLAALVACILGGGIYLVWAAPHILPEAAAQVVLAGTLTRISKEEHHNWMSGIIWSTWIPFVMVMIMAGALGWEAHHHCPGAHRLLEVFNCPVK